MRAAFFDVDGTLTTTRVWQGLMDYFQERGENRFTHLAFWAYHMPIYALRKLKLISEGAFRTPWALHLPWYFRGYSIEQANEIWDWITISYMRSLWRWDVRNRLDEHLAAGDLVVLVSGGPVPLLRRIGEELGVDHVIGTRVEVRQGSYTGRGLPPACIDHFKASLTQAYLRENGFEVELESSYAYADAVSDLPMLELVGTPVVVYPSEELLEVAHQRGWERFPPE
jgi:HAD superfamily hydrolase (TIGR01490 family)